MLLFLVVLVPLVQGLAILSKTDFTSPTVVKSVSDADSNDSSSSRESVELLLFGTKRRNGTKNYVPLRKVQVRFPSSSADKRRESTSQVSKGKETEDRVPIVRGAATPMRNAELTLASSNIEGLSPPSEYASVGWSPSSHLESNSKYPDSNGYYPDVSGGGGSQRPPYDYPRPVYGPPTDSPNCCCQMPGYPPSNYPKPPANYPQYPNYPGQNPSQNYPNQNPSQNYPSQNPSQNYPGQNPSQNYPNYPSSNYPNSQYPSSNSPGSNYPNSQYPSSNQYPSKYPSRYPSQNNWSSSNQWKSSSRQWLPCKPYDLSDRGRRETGCPSSGALTSPPATPTSKVDDKTSFNKLPRDVEEIRP